MNGIGLTILAVLLAMIAAAPSRWAALALLLGALYVTRGQVIELGPGNFTIPRLLVLAGLVRVLSRGDRLAGGFHAVDGLVATWAVVLLASSVAHAPDAWVFRAGMVLLECGCYVLFRMLVQDLSDIRSVFRGVCLAIVPVAALMLVERHTGQNLFGVFGGVNVFASVRDGQMRASGPFAHAILAGTVGAAAMAMGVALWRSDRRAALCGVLSGGIVVYACASSGPILMVLAMASALLAWHVRQHMRLILVGAVLCIFALAAVMKDPVYFLVARIDITGGSQGYFRAQLIRSSIEHFHEWWLAGTDITRHWMASGIHANATQTDITNHFLWMGVLGGLPLMIVFMLLVWRAFRDVGRGIDQHKDAPAGSQFMTWCIGVILFGFFVTFWSISLFDQSVLFFWMAVAASQAAAFGRAAVPHEAPDTGQARVLRGHLA